MKTRFMLLLWGLSLLSLPLASQPLVPEVVTINFLDPASLVKYRNARHRSRFIVRVQNVNKNFYKINETITQTNFNTSLPDIFEGIALPGYLTLSLPAFQSAEKLAYMPSSVRAIAEIDKQLKTISNSSQFLRAAAHYNNALVNIFMTCGVPYDTLEQEVVRVTQQFLPTPFPTSRSGQALGLSVSLATAIDQGVQARAKIQATLPVYLNDVAEQIARQDDIIWEWEKFPLDKKHPDYRSGLTRYRKARQATEGYNAQRDSTERILKQAYEQVSALEKFGTDNKIHALVNNYNLINEANFTYDTDTLLVTGDEVKVSIHFSAVKPLPCNRPDKLVIQETYRTKGGWKVDFSTGLFLNGGNDDFMGNGFQYTVINDSMTAIQRKDGGNRLLLSVGAFMHLYKRSGTDFNVALSPGLSTTTSFDGLNFHLGASAIIGKKERLVLSVGVTAREVEILDTHYRIDKPYPESGLPQKPPTVKVFPKAGWFAGLSYNWSRLKQGG